MVPHDVGYLARRDDRRRVPAGPRPPRYASVLHRSLARLDPTCAALPRARERARAHGNRRPWSRGRSYRVFNELAGLRKTTDSTPSPPSAGLTSRYHGASTTRRTRPSRFVARKCGRVAREGHRRGPRSAGDNARGSRAGALLQNGLSDTAKGELDLRVRTPNFLPDARRPRARRSGLLRPVRVAMVQLRWGHLNRESGAGSPGRRHSSSMAISPSSTVAACGAGGSSTSAGTAGVWRRAASRRCRRLAARHPHRGHGPLLPAQLRGWRFVYLDGAEVPAELPADMAAFRSQQFRWAKGQTQVARKLLPSVVRARLPLAVKLEGRLPPGQQRRLHSPPRASACSCCRRSSPEAPPHGGSRPRGAGARRRHRLGQPPSTSPRGVAGRSASCRLVMALCLRPGFSRQSRAVVEALAVPAPLGFSAHPHARGRRAGLPEPRPSAAASRELTLAGYFALTVPRSRPPAGRGRLCPFALLFAAGVRRGWLVAVRQKKRPVGGADGPWTAIKPADASRWEGIPKPLLQ
jgi:hypothetical protein